MDYKDTFDVISIFERSCSPDKPLPQEFKDHLEIYRTRALVTIALALEEIVAILGRGRQNKETEEK